MHAQYVTDALLAMLRAQVDGDGDNLRIGDALAPTDTGGRVTLPYAVLYPIGGDTYGPPIGVKLHSDATLGYQVTCVGTTRQRAQWMADKIRTAVLGVSNGSYANAIAPTGMTVTMREQVTLGRTSREGEIWNSIESYQLSVTPS